MTNYLVYSAVGLAICILVYLVLLKREKSFQFNRFYLIGSLILCLMAPILNFGLLIKMPELPQIAFQPTINEHIIDENVTITSTETIKSGTPLGLQISIGLYFFIAALLFFRFSRNLRTIFKLMQQKQDRVQGMHVVYIEEENSTSSFFNYLFVNRNDLNNADGQDALVRHELTHSQHLHSIDNILVELVLCVFWFNPFIWLYRKAILQNHEFIADQSVVESGTDLESYSNRIIYSGQPTSHYNLSSGLHLIQTKNRIIMLHQSKSSVLKRTIKSVIAILLVAGIVTLSAFNDNKPQLVVVIDAAHGGKDPGNSIEKHVVLNISKALANYSNQKVKIIQTRTSDEFLSLKDRADFINSQNADLLISLHCNVYQKDPEVNGVEAFYYKDSDFNELSYNYSKILIENQLQHFSNRGEVKNAGFYLLKNIKCPGVILELGFLSNKVDTEFLKDPKNQEKIANSIFQNLLQIRDNK